MTEQLAAAADDVYAEFWAIGGESRTLNGARCVRNRAAPRVGNCNVVTRLVGDDPGRLGALLGEAADWIAAPAMRVHVGAATTTTTEAALLLAGWRVTDHQVQLALTGSGPAPLPPTVSIQAAVSDSDWEQLTTLFRLDHEEEAAREGRPVAPVEYTHQAVRARRAKTSHVRYWLARDGATPCGFVASWPGTRGIGVVEDLFVHPRHRGAGVATRLLHHAIADARAERPGPVLIRADATDWPKDLYHRLGFQPVAATRVYRPEER